MTSTHATVKMTNGDSTRVFKERPTVVPFTYQNTEYLGWILELSMAGHRPTYFTCPRARDPQACHRSQLELFFIVRASLYVSHLNPLSCHLNLVLLLFNARIPYLFKAMF